MPRPQPGKTSRSAGYVPRSACRVTCTCTDANGGPPAGLASPLLSFTIKHGICVRTAWGSDCTSSSHPPLRAARGRAAAGSEQTTVAPLFRHALQQLHHGWVFGRLMDLKDGQYTSLRRQLQLLLTVAATFVGGRHVAMWLVQTYTGSRDVAAMAEWRIRYYCAFSVVLVIVLHGVRGAVSCRR